VFEMSYAHGHLLSWLIFSPLIGVLFLLLFSRLSDVYIRRLGMVAGTIPFLLSLIVLAKYDPTLSGMQLGEKVPWSSFSGVQYILGVDGLSIWFLVLTTFLTLVVLCSAASVKKHIRAYICHLLILEIGILGAFLALDGVLFYVFWEIMLIPMYFLIGVWGGQRKHYAALKFVLYTSFGSLLMLVGIVYLGLLHLEQFGNASFAFADWQMLSLSQTQEHWLFAAFALAFAIKIPIFPLHTWLPDAHVEAPTGGSVILAGVLLKMGLYGLLRICVPIFPIATVSAGPLFIVLGLLGVSLGALLAWVQTDMKKLVAYSSISHLGLCVVGYGVMNFEGIQGVVLQMLNHGISTAALFLLVGAIYERAHTREIIRFGGLADKVPFFAAVLLVFTLSSIGLPLTNGFTGEFLIFWGSYNHSFLVVALAVMGVSLGAIYMLSFYRRVVFGPVVPTHNIENISDLSLREKLVFLPMIILVFYIGISPGKVLSYIEPASRTVLSYIEREHKQTLPLASERKDTGVRSCGEVERR